MHAKHPELEWRVEDVRKLSLANNSTDIAIDKASAQELSTLQRSMLMFAVNSGCHDVWLAVGSS